MECQPQYYGVRRSSPPSPPPDHPASVMLETIITARSARYNRASAMLPPREKGVFLTSHVMRPATQGGEVQSLKRGVSEPCAHLL